MQEYTLVVMAAGLGSRFQSAKQITPIDSNEQFIIDYSVYDAIKAGFKKVIFVISQKHEEYFKETIGKRINDKIEVEYVIQKLNDLPEGYIAKGRTKPWGTGHAIYAAKDHIKGPFAVINADDFYGYEAFEILMDFLKNNQAKNCYLTVCYKVKNTISEYGDVTRGVAKVKNGVLEDIKESVVTFEDGKITATPLDKTKSFKITDDDLTSVNMFGFTTNFIRNIEPHFSKFLDQNINDSNIEFLLPNIVKEEIQNGEATVYVKTSPSKWYGMTYKEDKETLMKVIQTYIADGKYPKDLWN